MPCGYAAHVDGVYREALSTPPTIAWTTLRVAHIPTRPVMNSLYKGEQKTCKNARQKKLPGGRLKS